jgi:hypothetical protein
VLESVPVAGLRDQAGVEFDPVTVAVNCWVCPALRLAEDGLTFTETETTGLRVTVADADLLGFATDVAVIVTVCWVKIVEGARYKPAAERLPTAGDTDQVTAELEVPLTLAVNCWLRAANKLTVAGLTDTDTVPVVPPPVANAKAPIG